MTRIGLVSGTTLAAIRSALKYARWQVSKGEGVNYRAWTNADAYVEHILELRELWDRERWLQAWFVKLPALNGHLHRHNDGAKTFDTYHIPVQTNKQAICIDYPNGIEHRVHVAMRGVYQIDRSVDHEAINTGRSDRIHLLMDISR